MSSYLANLLVLFCLYSALGAGLTLLVGKAGLFSVAHGLCFGMGAYAVALLTTRTGIGWWAAAGIGVALAAILGLLIAAVSLRVNEDYLVIASFGVQIIGTSLLMNLRDLTGGVSGVGSIEGPVILGWEPLTPTDYFWVAAVIAVLLILIGLYVDRSAFGRVVQASRDDPIAVAALGKRGSAYKIAIFAIVAGLAAVAGGFYASYRTFIAPNDFDINLSILLLTMIVLGGLGRISGAIIGAAVLVTLPEVIRQFPFDPARVGLMEQIVYGLVLVVLVATRPSGLVGDYRFRVPSRPSIKEKAS